MKKRHLIRLFLCIFWMGVFFLPLIYDALMIIYIHNFEDSFYFTNAEIIKVSNKNRDAYNIDVQYNDGENTKYKVMPYRQGDLEGDIIPIAVRKNDRKIFRMQLPIYYIHFSMFVALSCLIILENVHYRKQLKIYRARKQR